MYKQINNDHQETEREASTPRGAVAAGSPYAARAGSEILRHGGNAADAAVAATLALCVADPANASLLGRAQILWRAADGTFSAIDGASAVPDAIPQAPNLPMVAGGLSLSAIPGLPQALEQLHARHGRLSLAQVAEPATQLAENGIVPPAHLAAVWDLRAGALVAGDAKPYSGEDCHRPRVPEEFRHPRLAKLLREFGQDGARSITSGENAKMLVEGIRQRGGYWSLTALANNNARDGELLHGKFRDYTITTIGRQGWGHSLLQMLAILDAFPAFGKTMTGEEARRLLLTIRRAFADRPQRLGTLEPKPFGLALETLVSGPFVSECVAQISAELAVPEGAAWARPRAPIAEMEDQDTTHLSAIDANGSTVSLTCSIGPHFGLRVTDPTFGLLPAKSYRMETDPVPGARDVTEMSPVIVSREDRPVLVLGGAGSERIPGAVVQVIVNFIDRGLRLNDAVRFPRVNIMNGAPRVHADIGRRVIADLVNHGLTPEISNRGHINHLGIVHAVGMDMTGCISGAADDAWDGIVSYA